MMTERLSQLAVMGVFLMAIPCLAAGSGGQVSVRPPDAIVITQDGEKTRFLSEVIGDRIAAITFTYTTCPTACPVLDGIFKELQVEIDEALGQEVVMVTLSIDPVRDTPARMRAHAQMLGAKPGWSFLTGERPVINGLLKALEVYSPDIVNHPPTVFVVDGKRNIWKRLSGFPPTEQIVGLIDEFRTSRTKS